MNTTVIYTLLSLAAIIAVMVYAVTRKSKIQTPAFNDPKEESIPTPLPKEGKDKDPYKQTNPVNPQS